MRCSAALYTNLKIKSPMDVDAHANHVIPQMQMQMQMQIEIEIQPSQPCCELSKNGNVLVTALFLLFCDIPVICIASFRTSYSMRTIALFFIVAVLVQVYVFCAHKFIILDRERSVVALKLRWICAVVLLLISVAYPACLYSFKLPLSCRVIAWTMFAIHFFAAILGNFGYILNNHREKAIYPVA